MLDRPVNLILGPDESLTTSAEAFAREAYDRTVDVLAVMVAVAVDSVRVAGRCDPGRHHPQALPVRRHRRDRGRLDHLDSRGAPEIGKAVTERSTVPVIGIGAGPHCDGQCLVVHDVLGMFEAFTPKFAKQYVDLREQAIKAFEAFKDDLKKGEFPKPEHCYRMPAEEVKKLDEMLKGKKG